MPTSINTPLINIVTHARNSIPYTIVFGLMSFSPPFLFFGIYFQALNFLSSDRIFFSVRYFLKVSTVIITIQIVVIAPIPLSPLSGSFYSIIKPRKRTWHFFQFSITAYKIFDFTVITVSCKFTIRCNLSYCLYCYVFNRRVKWVFALIYVFVNLVYSVTVWHFFPHLGVLPVEITHKLQPAFCKVRSTFYLCARVYQ